MRLPQQAFPTRPRHIQSRRFRTYVTFLIEFALVLVSPLLPLTSMASANQISAEAGAGPAISPDGTQTEQFSLVPVRSAEANPAPDPPHPIIARIPVELDVSIPLHNFRVRNLLALGPGVVVESRWNHGEDLPLAAGKVHLAWTEFEVVDTTLAVRITRLA